MICYGRRIKVATSGCFYGGVKANVRYRTNLEVARHVESEHFASAPRDKYTAKNRVPDTNSEQHVYLVSCVGAR